MNWFFGKKEDIIPVQLIDVKNNTYAVQYAVRDYTPSEQKSGEYFIPDCQYLEKNHCMHFHPRTATPSEI